MKLTGAAAIVGAAYGGTGLLRRLREPDLLFEPMADLPGFRRMAGGQISGGASALVGIGEGKPQTRIENADICTALFGPAPDPTAVQIAYFTDYRCLYCRTVSPALEKLEKRPDVQVTWHDLPLLGRVSERAALTAVAAARQGAYAQAHRRLMGTPMLPTPPYLRQLAADLGIDADQLLRDMASAETRQHLDQTAALARRFGFIGTPALVVGRTAVLGGIDQRLLERLIAAEQRENPICAA